ncbi:MAG: polyphosphate glucokinase [Anaerolineae bacterium UTCFX2]|jgi:polyphosphate glucokinase|nr:ROK family protein [Anaerolineales bacterium]OQY87282.1 MAG: polyphosphate glucokinase [Anaerolineae bacterium UTCFX2]
MEILGIDIGGSGIKGAPVETETGQMLAPRFRLPTPEAAKPEAMIEIINEIVQFFQWTKPIGCGFPGVVRNGVALSAVNLSNKWVGYHAAARIAEKTGCPTCVFNDADAAGLAEVMFGTGKDRRGVILVVTIGTGLGTALFTDGHLLPNAELGHIEIGGEDAEWRASDAARKREKLSWKKWGQRFNRYLNTLCMLLSPDLIILGGGTSSKYEKFSRYISVPTEIELATMLNEAGIVGAALAGGICLANDEAVHSAPSRS